VASTKAYTSQVLVLVLFGLMMSEDRVSAQARRHEVIAALVELPEKLRTMLALDSKLKVLAERYMKAENLYGALPSLAARPP
jgi:glucosamine--fructose-6-phosphate aminotransferase (isomerizing)